MVGRQRPLERLLTAVPDPRASQARPLPRAVTLLGIDPGTATTGWGVVRQEGNRLCYVQHGAITTPSDWEMPRRLGKVFAGILALLEGYEPDALAVEELFFGRNVSSAITVGQARGTVLLAAHLSRPGGTPVFEYKPAEIKQAVTSYGAADKRQVQQMVKTLLKLKDIPRPDDAADGLAVALCHAFTARMTS